MYMYSVGVPQGRWTPAAVRGLRSNFLNLLPNSFVGPYRGPRVRSRLGRALWYQLPAGEAVRRRRRLLLPVVTLNPTPTLTLTLTLTLNLTLILTLTTLTLILTLKPHPNQVQVPQHLAGGPRPRSSPARQLSVAAALRAARSPRRCALVHRQSRRRDHRGPPHTVNT
eukprot:scaffold86616_cov52-Phaeocystis_antarctica.AAC.2